MRQPRLPERPAPHPLPGSHLQVCGVRHVQQRVPLPNLVLAQEGENVGWVGQAVGLRMGGVWVRVGRGW